MALAAGQYEGRVGGRVYDTSGPLGATPQAHTASQLVNVEMTTQRAMQLQRKRDRIQAAQGRAPAGGDQRFWHQTQKIEKQSDMVLLGRTPVQAQLASSAARRNASYQRKIYHLQTFAAHPVQVHPIPRETQTVALTGLGACVIGACLGALLL